MSPMKILRLILVAMFAALFLPLVAIAGEGSWFDMEHCAFCKHMSAEEGMLDHVHWETHKIADGMLSVTVVEPEWKEAWDRAMAKMEATGEKMMQGEQMKMCGHCQSYGALHMAGVSFEDIETDVGIISLATSDKPDVVKMIHKHAQRTIEEMAKMEESEKGHDHSSHEGHSHGG
jgi:hypothetical protein